MRNLTIRGCSALFMLVVLILIGTPEKALAGVDPNLPDLAPYGLESFVVTNRLGGPTLEFSILTANIGGQDFVRPFDPDNPTQRLLRQIYEYALFQDQSGTWVEVDRRRKNTICTIDDTRRGNVFPCIQEHGAIFTCGANQGISRGWADDYFRGLNGQWSFIGANTGRFRLDTILDPDGDLQRTDIPDSGRDSDPTNNVASVFFTYDGGASITIEQIVYGFDDNICP